MDQNIKKLKAESKSLKPILTIGKEGINQNGLENIRKHLKANKLTKIKIAKNYLDNIDQNKKEVAIQIAKEVKAEVIDVVGFVVVLYKR